MRKIIASIAVLVMTTLSCRAFEVRQAYPAPSADELLGPIIINCDPPKFCFASGDTLEAAPTGNAIQGSQLAGARPNDFLIGTARELGLPGPAAVTEDYYRLLNDATRAYNEWKESTSRLSAADSKILANSKPEFKSLPQAFRSEIQQYAESEPAAKCSVTIRAMDNLKADPKYQDVNNVLMQASLQGYLHIAYRSACLSTDMPAKLGPYLKRLVYFLDTTDKSDNAPLVCSGFIIGGNVGITARHCLVDGPELSTLHFQINNGLVDALRATIEIKSFPPGRRAVVLGVVGGVFKVEIFNNPGAPAINSFGPYRDASKDFAFFRLVGLSADRFGPMPPASPSNLAQLIVVGMAATQRKMLDLVNTSASDEDLITGIKPYMTIDKSPLCRFLKMKHSCIIHDCQTENGYSGTPILMETRTGYDLIGVHTGSFGAELPACGFTRGDFIRNYGIRPPGSMVKKVMGVLSARQADGALERQGANR